MPDIIIWAVAFIVLTLLEVQTIQLVSIWFAISALVTMFVAIAGASLWIQLVVFVCLSVILLIATRPFVKKFLNHKNTPTNADLDIGKNATVIEDIDNVRQLGRVKIDGVDWMARSVENEIIPSGNVVTVVDVQGAKLIVTNRN